MVSAKELLHFNLDIDQIRLPRNPGILRGLPVMLNKHTTRLERIKEDMTEKEFQSSGTLSLAQIAIKFIEAYKENVVSDTFQQRRELRALSYCLTLPVPGYTPIFKSEDEIQALLNVLDNDWRYSYFPGLFDTVLKEWNSDHRNSLMKIRSFVVEKLQQYDGRRSTIIGFKENIRFFEHDIGALKLGIEMAAGKEPFTKVTTFSSVPESRISYYYFAYALFAYYERVKKNLPEHLDDMLAFLNIHGKHETSLIFVSKLIIQCEEQQLSELQPRIKNVALQIIRDPEQNESWRIVYRIATEKDQKDIARARAILNEWLTKEFISLFFEKCINDRRRKQFWLKYASHVSKFKIVGSKDTRRILSDDKRLKKFIDARFCNVQSGGGLNAALILVVGNNVLIEFSDSGAFYAYQLQHPMAKVLEWNSLHSFSEIKDTSLDRLAYREGYHIYKTNPQGSLYHTDGHLSWEDVFKHWLKKYTGIDV